MSLPALTTAEIVAVGSELLVPPRLDTNSLTVTDGLAALGIGVDAIADDVLGADADTERGEAVGDGQGVCVEARRDQQLAADRDDLGRGEGREAHSHTLIATAS